MSKRPCYILRNERTKANNNLCDFRSATALTSSSDMSLSDSSHCDGEMWSLWIELKRRTPCTMSTSATYCTCPHMPAPNKSEKQKINSQFRLQSIWIHFENSIMDFIYLPFATTISFQGVQCTVYTRSFARALCAEITHECTPEKSVHWCIYCAFCIAIMNVDDCFSRVRAWKLHWIPCRNHFAPWHWVRCQWCDHYCECTRFA